MVRAAARIVRDDAIRVVHCRSFPPALIAHYLKRKLGLKFIFDFRHFFADDGLEKARGPARLVFHRLKHLEGPMIRNADKVVCLTYSARKLLSDWYLNAVERPEDRFQIIPCCADFEYFDPSRLTSEEIQTARRKATIPVGAFVLIYLGSLGPDYLLGPMLSLFRQLLVLKPEAYFLFVSNNGRDLVARECEAQQISNERVRFVSADRSEVPSLIALASLSVLFYRVAISRVGCSPTKLGELFACNVPVIANSGIGDLDDILSLEKNGSVVVKDFSEIALRTAVEQVLAARDTRRVSIRESSREFSLEEGVDRYAAVYRELLNQ
jgi:glycosyltransferase involved in cell wall biosynthesis